jgi:hypothetical protein
MQCLLLLSSRPWACALSGSVRGRVSEFRDAPARGYASLRSRENPSLCSNPRLDLLSLFAFDGIAKPLK